MGARAGGAPDEIKAGVGKGFAADVRVDGGEHVGSDDHLGTELRERGLERAATLGEAAEAGDVLGQFFKNDFCAGGGEGGEFLRGGDGHAARRGDDEDAVTGVAAREERAGRGAGLLELRVGDVVEAIAFGHEGAGDFADGLVGEPFDVVNGEGFDGAGFVVEEVFEGPIKQDVVVGLAALQNGLDAGDVVVEGAEIVPPRVVGIELGGGVEKPAGPRGVLRRVNGAVVKDVVDAVGKNAVELGLHEGEGFLPVIAEPRGGFAGGERVAGDVRGGRGEANDQGFGEVLVIVGDVGGVATEAGDRKGRGTKNLGFGDVGVGVEIEEITGSAVALVAHDVAVIMRPFYPRAQVVEVELGEGLAVVALDAAEGFAPEAFLIEFRDVGRRAREQRGRVVLDIVAVHLAENLGEPRGPVGAVVFERVVELAADEAGREFVGGERLIEL